jgi:protein-L-isoaspartate(D-aspartate) O-methyltransferase
MRWRQLRLTSEADITRSTLARPPAAVSCPGEAMSGYELARANMIERQLRPNMATDERVVNAFANLRRELFLPAMLHGTAYADKDLPLGGGRYLMAPMVAGRLVQALDATPGDVALVVAAGVGYEAALLAQLCRGVVALEDDAELARLGRAALVDHRIATVKFAEGSPAQASRTRPAYDVILFGGAVAEIPEEIVAQLAEGGRMAVVVRADDGPGRATLATRAGGILARRVMFDAATPILPGFARKSAFVF